MKEINKIVRDYCQGKFWRIFLLLSFIGICEVGILMGIFSAATEQDISSLIPLFLTFVVVLSAFIASEGKHLFK